MKAIQQIPKIDVQAAKVEEVADREPIVEREVECKVPEIVEVVEKEEERGTIEIQVGKPFSRFSPLLTLRSRRLIQSLTLAVILQ